MALFLAAAEEVVAVAEVAAGASSVPHPKRMFPFSSLGSPWLS
jgi:hypothetical protein